MVAEQLFVPHIVRQHLVYINYVIRTLSWSGIGIFDRIVHAAPLPELDALTVRPILDRMANKLVVPVLTVLCTHPARFNERLTAVGRLPRAHLQT